MSASDALGEVGQLDDGFLKRVHLRVFPGEGDTSGAARHVGVAQAFGISGELAREATQLEYALDQLRVLDRIDALRETDHESIDLLCQLGNVFLGRSDRRFVVEHLARHIGRRIAKLEARRDLTRPVRGHGGGAAPTRAAWIGSRRARDRQRWRLRAIWRNFSSMQCHACQTEIPIASGESVGFRDACDRCRADLHVCLNCAHHDPSAYNGCRESSAERVLDPDRANRCDYFRPAEGLATGADGRDAAMASLESLFKKS